MEKAHKMQEKKKQYILDNLLRIILAMFVLTVLFAFSCLLLSHGAHGIWLAVLALFVLFYHRIFAITFDESFSRATGMRVGLYNTVLSVLTALTIVLGMRLMGAMLISSLVIFPALTAMRLLRSFRGVVICAGVLSVVCFCAGLTGSYLLSTPVGATVVLADLAAFLLACGAAGLKKRA